MKLIIPLQVALSSIVIFRAAISAAEPLNPEDVESLLPETPMDTNDTLAAVVQDPVVKDAVHHAASNGSLNGLVVKKRVFVMPANDPNKVLSEREQILVVPTEHLEDVRRNITEAKESEPENVEYTSVEKQTSFGTNADEQATEGNESGSPYPNDLGLSLYDASGNSAFASGDSKTDFLEDTILREAELPADVSKKVSVPIIAVVDPSDINDGKVESPIVAILPNQIGNSGLKSQVDFLKDNRQQIREEAQSYIDGTSLTIDPNSDRWIPSILSRDAAPSSLNYETRSASSVQNPEASNIVAEQLLLTSIIIPPLEIPSPLLQTPKSTVYPRDTDDMDVAEDIIFRPLFRYRQEAQQRLKYQEESDNRRRYSYRQRNPYRTYNSYPRREYRYESRYDNDYQ